MGYVLPVIHFQYQDYKHRVTANKQHKFYVARAERPRLKRTDQGVMSNAVPYQKDVKANGRQKFERYDKALYAEITGKGRYVSEHV